MPKQSVPIRIKFVAFRNFKALSAFSLSLDKLNILVGPNNAGKSTILAAFRLLSVALSKANNRRPEPVAAPLGRALGYKVSPSDLEISLENVHTNLTESDSEIHFKLSNNASLLLYFPIEGGCTLICQCDRAPQTPTTFQKQFPLSVVTVPVLGPLEYEEALVKPETVRTGLITHRASRHFRSYWHHYPETFDQFSAMLSETWPGMAIQRPERVDLLAKTLYMFCTEGTQTREIYWAGFGFQVWCQILTHLVRASDASLVVIDEPEIYLHPTLQRNLLTIVRRLNCDVVLATHSSEIVNEAEPNEVVIIDKRERRGRRIRGMDRLQDALEILGSRQDVLLTQLARSRRIVFVEGEDAKPLRSLARVLGFRELGNADGVTFVPIRGFSNWQQIATMQEAFSRALGDKVSYAVVLDRDYRCDEEILDIESKIALKTVLCHVHGRKEVENYLLVESAIVRASLRRARERRVEQIDDAEIQRLFWQAIEGVRTEVLSQRATRAQEYKKKAHGTDGSTVFQKVLKEFDAKWNDPKYRIAVVPGKRVFSDFNRVLQDTLRFTITPALVFNEMRSTDVATDMTELMWCLEEMRKADPGRYVAGRK